MTDTFRNLCVELADELTQFNAWYIEDNGYGRPNLEALLCRCDAALAQPEPVAPTDEEIMELMPQQMRDDLATAARAMIGFDNPKAAAACRIILNRHAVDHARAVLARWGGQ